MALSSSAIKNGALGHGAPVSLGSAVWLRWHGQEDAEDGAARRRFAFDDAAMVADDLGDQREAKAGARGLVGDERIEDVLLQ